ncbi:DNA polymerase III subunit delta' [Serratia symbiotica]|nr:DNA polymerase III subunit delta' [Serratia symbiotica]
MNKYPWLSVIYHNLIKYYSTGKGHHALLLHSFEDNGEFILISKFHCWLLCQQRKNEYSCNKCHSCSLLLSGNHPDYYYLIPEKNQKTLSIIKIRQIIEKLYFCSQQNGNKVIWIPESELLTEEAANALLKILEEPPEKTYFFLSCRYPLRLLATLRSRCLYWRLNSPDEKLSIEWLSNHVSGNLINYYIALGLYNGSPIAAKNFLQSNRWKQRIILCSILSKAILKKDMLLLLPVLNDVNVIEYIYWLSTLLIDTIKFKQNLLKYILNKDQKLLLLQLSNCICNISLLKIIKKWLICRYQLLNFTGINRELLLTKQLLDWEYMFNI